MRLPVVGLLLALAGCSSSSPSSAPTAPPSPPRSWLGMDPEGARVLNGPGGELDLLYVDETYSIDGTNASAFTLKHGDDYVTDFFVQDDDGTLWWYGQRGSWRAGRHGEDPRTVPIVDHRARFGDVVITVSDDGPPVQVETPDGVYVP